jgi:hypothetical protein
MCFRSYNSKTPILSVKLLMQKEWFNTSNLVKCYQKSVQTEKGALLFLGWPLLFATLYHLLISTGIEFVTVSGFSPVQLHTVPLPAGSKSLFLGCSSLLLSCSHLSSEQHL